jgi:cytoskeletal protein CcmA (bactofilin family)
MKIWDFVNIFFGTELSPDDDLAEIKGTFKGGIYNGIKVLVASSGYVEGEIKTKTLEIAGKVEGSIETEKLIIRSSGQLHYHKLKYSDLIVEDGGVLAYKGEAKNNNPGLVDVSEAKAGRNQPEVIQQPPFVTESPCHDEEDMETPLVNDPETDAMNIEQADQCQGNDIEYGMEGLALLQAPSGATAPSHKQQQVRFYNSF